MPAKKTPRYLRRESRAVCTCCGSSLASGTIKRTLGLSYSSWGNERSITLDDLHTGRFRWACDRCLKEGLALPANPVKQLYCDHEPYLAYCDWKHACRSCKRSFIFTAAEQKHWYETLGFWVQSVPVRCPDCRKQLRRRKALNTELGELLKLKDPDASSLFRISAIYRVMGNEAKAKRYERLAKKIAT